DSQNGFFPPPTDHTSHHTQQTRAQQHRGTSTTSAHHTTLPLSHKNLASHSRDLPTKITSHTRKSGDRHRRARSKSTESKGRFVKHHGHWYRVTGEETRKRRRHSRDKKREKREVNGKGKGKTRRHDSS